MTSLRKLTFRLSQWNPPRLPLKSWQTALLWWIALAFAGALAGRHFKYPDPLLWRTAETPLVLMAACIGAWSARRARKLSTGSPQRLESGFRLAFCVLLAILVIAQEGWFRWQQYQAFRGGSTQFHIGQRFVAGSRANPHTMRTRHAHVAVESFFATMALSETPRRAASTASARCRFLSMRTLNVPE